MLSKFQPLRLCNKVEELIITSVHEQRGHLFIISNDDGTLTRQAIHEKIQ